jgi:hypothetical protein
VARGNPKKYVILSDHHPKQIKKNNQKNPNGKPRKIIKNHISKNLLS